MRPIYSTADASGSRTYYTSKRAAITAYRRNRTELEVCEHHPQALPTRQLFISALNLGGWQDSETIICSRPPADASTP